MPLVKIAEECYTALDNMKEKLIKQKRKAGQPEKTTFSECVCMLLRETGRLPES